MRVQRGKEKESPMTITELLKYKMDDEECRKQGRKT